MALAKGISKKLSKKERHAQAAKRAQKRKTGSTGSTAYYVGGKRVTAEEHAASLKKKKEPAQPSGGQMVTVEKDGKQTTVLETTPGLFGKLGYTYIDGGQQPTAGDPSDELRDLSIAMAKGTSQTGEERDTAMQAFADQQPEQADNLMDQLGYDGTPNQGQFAPEGAGFQQMSPQDQATQLRRFGELPMETVGAEYVNVGGQYYQKTPQGMAPVVDPRIQKSLSKGQIPSSVPDASNNFIFGEGAGAGGAAVMGTPTTPNVTNSMGYYQGLLGTPVTQDQFSQNPLGTLSDMTSGILDALGMGEMTVLIENEADEIEKLENKRDDELRDVNDNPWFTEGVRVREREKVNEKYQDELGNKEAKLHRLQRNKELTASQAQWALGTAISMWDSERRFQQQQAQQIYGMQQDALEWQYKQAVFDRGIEQFEADLAYKEWNAEQGFALDREQLGLQWYNAKTSRKNAETAERSSFGSNLDATTRRQYQERVDAADTLMGLIQEYRGLVSQHGVSGLNREVQGKMNTLYGLMQGEIKQYQQLGALDAGVITLTENILGQPMTGYMNLFGGKTDKALSSLDSLTTQLVQQRNKYGERLYQGAVPTSNPTTQNNIFETSGNTYVLPEATPYINNRTP